jgi:hypothetical protein
MKKTEDSLLTEVKERCGVWAEWYSGGKPYGLGYPSASLEYRILRGGGRKSFTGLPCHAAAEEIEAWVSDMARYHPQMAQILRCYYFEAQGLRAGAEQLAMGVTAFKEQLEKAHHWLAGRLSFLRGNFKNF